jgi:GntR family transcriptional regulator
MDQVNHAVETGALRSGDQLPTMRKLAEDLIMNPNTVIRAYRELEHEDVIELRQGSGAFISEAVIGRMKVMRKAQTVAQSAIERLAAFGLTEQEMRRVLENELAFCTSKFKATEIKPEDQARVVMGTDGKPRSLVYWGVRQPVSHTAWVKRNRVFHEQVPGGQERTKFESLHLGKLTIKKAF